MRSPLRCVLGGFVLASVVVVLGCGSTNPVVKVTGVVTHKGKPVPNLFLSFQPDEGRPSWGQSDAEGRFVLRYDDKQDGARVGMHTVTAMVRAGSPAEELAMQSGKIKITPEARAISDRYGPDKPNPLRFEIRPDQPEIELKLD